MAPPNRPASLPGSVRHASARASSHAAIAPLLAAVLALAACADDVAPCDVDLAPQPVVVSAGEAGGGAALEITTAAAEPHVPARPDCDAVDVFAAGAHAGRICEADAQAAGLTVVDLSDTWTPRVFAQDPATGRVSEYRDTYLELARSPTADLGLYGVSPTPRVLAKRLADADRLACSASVDRAAIARLASDLDTDKDERARRERLKSAAAKPGVVALQHELACEGLMKATGRTGNLGTTTLNALDTFRRRHMIVGAELDRDTRNALALGGDELSFRALLRALRERVATAAELVEDGSAASQYALVVDRQLDLTAFYPSRDPLPDAAPDLVGQATDAAARALGWTGPEEARAFFAAQRDVGALRIAVPLPERPTYHSAAMDLSVEIDRGDVFHGPPGQAAAARKQLADPQGPTLVLYATDGDHKRALIRWSTTIGGWKQERGEDGELALKYKESDVGDRVWQKILAAPAWMPPESTPETDLIHEAADGTITLKRSLIYPGHRNAYGLAMLIHEEPRARKKDDTVLLDHGIRTHGSVDFRSIGRGTSHGCHRLHNQLVLRLTGYLLAHRPHTVRGQLRAGYRRTIEWNEQTIEVDIPTRGHLFELDPPVAVRVLPGRIAGDPKQAVSSARKPAPGRG